MKITLSKITNIVILCVLLATGYIFRDSVYKLIVRLYNQVQPCQQPITYSIGTFDKRFGISKDTFLADIKQAAQIWGTAIHKDLFKYSDHGVLTINLVYDARQASTIQLQKIGVVIHDDQGSYDDLKVKYNALEASYQQQKINLDVQVAAYQNEKSAYEKDVAYWNARGGAPKAEFAKLEEQRQALNAQIDVIKQAQDSLNQTVDSINALAAALNKLAAELNLHAKQYNTIGGAGGSEFQEGVYKSDISGSEIDIYQFDDRTKLLRVLAHELGHSLGLGHLDNPKAIMYKLNEGSNEKPSPDDINALKTLCRIK